MTKSKNTLLITAINENKRIRHIIISFFVVIAINIIISFAIFGWLIKRNNLVRFENKPREENESYGFFKIDNKNYFQVYTTTQVNIGNGLHYHKIDIRGNPAN
ncbi:MAG: hypothetical protein AAB656_04440 [Patescibacteria group bacterium]